MTTTPDHEFVDFSKRLGEDFTLVQGAGGNTSYKDERVLFVKASGTRLAQANEKCIFARLPIGTPPFREKFPSDGDLKPSIETSLHLLLPHKVVAHAHAVNTIAVSTLAHAKELLAETLSDLPWAFTPYRKPGVATAHAVAEAIADHAKRDLIIIILGNHGIVVGGQDCRKVEMTMREVESRLAACNRTPELIDPDMRMIQDACPSGFAPVQQPEAHWTALDETALRIATGGTLYPDHVVFLGRGVSLWKDQAMTPDISRSRLVIKPDIGAYVPEEAPYAAHEMAGALGLIASRIADPDTVKYLSHDDESALLDWDAEKYRQKLNDS